MSSKKIKYNRVVLSKAMSKSPYQSGLSLTSMPSSETIRIESINPRLDAITSHLLMEIPYENISDVIGALVELKTEIENGM